MLNLDDILATSLDARYKGIPPGVRITLGEIGAQGWNVAAGDLALPTTTLYRSALEHNLRTMAEYCAGHGALLAPHGKTTMAPQLFDRQLRAGAWALTAATTAQAATMRGYGVKRVIIANELVEPAAIAWAAAEMDADDAVEVMSLVDDAETVTAMDAVLAAAGARRALPVLLEVGLSGGRAGVRDPEQAIAVARAVAAARHLRLVGVETYEGLAAAGASPAELAEIDALLARVRELVGRLDREGLFDTGTVLVTAGGSSYFDRVVAGLSWPGSERIRLVLRSGCYISHDLGTYHGLSPLDGRRAPGEALRLRNALLGWAAVLSRPEPDLVIVGTGKRDLPYDLTLPVALRAYRPGSEAVTDLAGRTRTRKLMDQHLFLEVDEQVPLRPGDIVAFGLSHPCTAFDKMRMLPVIDDSHRVVDAVLTYF